MISYQHPAVIGGSGELSTTKKDKSDYIINKVVQALDILELFRDEVDELSLTQISKMLSINENSVRLLLATLRSRNYLEYNASTGNFRLGYKTLELAQTVLRQIDLYRVSHPVLTSIFSRCGETTAVAVLSKSYVIELDAIQSEHPVQVVSRVGVHLPLHCTAAGKALLAAQHADVQERVLQGMELKSYTPKTVAAVEELRLRLREISEKGYAIDDEEIDREVRGVASPIYDYAGSVVGAVVVTGPSCRMSVEELNGKLAALVQEGAREISARLGFNAGEAGRAVVLLPRPRRKRESNRKSRVSTAANV